MSDDFHSILEAHRQRIAQRKAEAWTREFGRFTFEDCAFVKRHYQRDMSPLQLARYFGCEISDIDVICKKLKLKVTRNQLRMTAFCTPYPPQIARNVRKFSWANYHGDNADGQTETHPADSN